MIKVLRDFVAVTKQAEADKSAGGIHMVHFGNEDKVTTGVVVAVGSGHLVEGGSEPLEVTEGDKIVFNKSLAVEVKDGETSYFVLRETNILAVLA